MDFQMDTSDFGIVYILDDDDAVRDSLRGLLESYGLSVRDYGSARDFLADLPQSRAGCLLLDLHMPGMTGLQLLEELRKDRSRLPVIAITGRSDPNLKQRVIQAGAFALLEKPMNDDVLLRTITSVVAVPLRVQKEGQKAPPGRGASA
jgi:FixJ family two-component response regulator